MGTMLFLGVIVLTIVTVVFLNYPAPEFSSRLKKWYKKGSFMKYKDFEIFYVVEDGIETDDSTLLCIHGFPTSGHDWIKILDGLKEQYSRIIIPDMLGFGFSDKPRYREYLIMEQADIMEAILLSLDAKETHLLSHDYGDTVALELLHRHNNNDGPIKILSLCMLNGGVFPETNFPRPTQRLALVPYIGDLLGHLSSYRIFKRGLGETFGPHTIPSDDDMADFYAAIRHKDGNKVFARLMQYIPQRGENKERWVGALQKSKAPVHMIYGPSDPVNPPVFINHYKKTVPNPSIDVLGAAIGHYPQWEDPTGVMGSYRLFLDRLRD